MSALLDLASILRLHIIGIAFTASIALGWLVTGRYPLGLACVGALDWIIINLLNRATDIEEDLANAIRGTERVARHRRAVIGSVFALMAASFAATHLIWPAVTPLRAAVQAIGTAYSFPLVPTPRGLRRFKDIYFLKNFMSAALFVLTVFLYPLGDAGWRTALPGGAAAVGCLLAFFLCFEITYEILYDMRDLEGDRAAGVPTYPVVHGLEGARRIVDALLAAAAVPIAAGVAAGVLGVREALLLAAPALQLAWYRPRYRRGLTSADCIALTHLGSAQLLLFLAGTRVWLAAGLPANIYL